MFGFPVSLNKIGILIASILLLVFGLWIGILISQPQIYKLREALSDSNKEKQQILDGYNSAASQLKAVSALLADAQEQQTKKQQEKTAARLVEYRTKVINQASCTLSNAAYETIKETIRD